MKRKNLLFIFILLMTIFLTGCQKQQELDVGQYIKIDLKGINGKATATVDFDFPALENDILTEDADVSYITKVIAFEESIKINAPVVENLSNGDVISISISWDSEKAKECNIDFNTDSFSYTVTDLSDGIPFNVFEDFELKYSGISPNGTVEISHSSPMAAYSLSAKNNLKNGDIITVTANVKESTLEKEGYFLEGETEKDFIVEGLDEYIQSYDQIDEKTLEKLFEMAPDCINEDLTNTFQYKLFMYPNESHIAENAQNITINSINKLLAYYVISENDLFFDHNGLYVIYEVSTTDSFQPEGKTTYISVLFKDLLKKDTEEIIFENSGQSWGSYDTIEDILPGITEYTGDYTYEEINYNN